MPNYTKLFNSLITSTIWTEDDKTRIVWITMLALADQHGEVHASIPGLARMAGVEIEACQAAIQKFLSPDDFSRTPNHEGRRIVEIQGGWELLNHAKYRALASKEDARIANAERQKRHRERNADVTPSNADVTHGGDIVEADTDTKAKAKAVQRTPKAQFDLESFMDSLAENPAYEKIDLHRELGKMRAWLGTPRAKGRKLTAKFILNWLNRIDVELDPQVPKNEILYQ